MDELSLLANVGKMQSDAAQRIAMADAKAAQAQFAFATGKFVEYFYAEYGAAEKAIADGIANIGGPPTPG